MTPSDIEKSRKEFEEEYIKLFGVQYCERTIDGSYMWADMENGWKIWQASRESLVVELPERNHNEYRPEFSHGWNTCLNKSILALSSAGINYRERE